MGWRRKILLLSRNWSKSPKWKGFRQVLGLLKLINPIKFQSRSRNTLKIRHSANLTVQYARNFSTHPFKPKLHCIFGKNVSSGTYNPLMVILIMYITWYKNNNMREQKKKSWKMFHINNEKCENFYSIKCIFYCYYERDRYFCAYVCSSERNTV